MANGKDTAKGRTGSGSANDRVPQSSHKEAFENWLEGRLHQIFDTVASEQVPDDLVRLLQQLKEKEESKK